MFVLILFREFPETNLFTIMGLLHTSYWLILILAGWMREKAKGLTQKWLATFVPVLYHLGIHIWVSYEAMHEHMDEHHHDEHSVLWLFIGAIVLGVLIYL
jgi:cytochrome bd-type quinol oxidase subunit 2